MQQLGQAQVNLTYYNWFGKKPGPVYIWYGDQTRSNTAYNLKKLCRGAITGLTII
jgi:hypothetical protein